ncbi:uncharacterized protein LOC143469603 [Clavelina lepadiformis]|uniref:uncharacterized protein LOC143469603 n=1 Tax=Clavelina lepadiformis TaxID=159417 RepID=UPI004043727A
MKLLKTISLIYILLTLNMKCLNATGNFGHLLPFGSHREPSVKVLEINSVPQPIEFFENYVEPRRPVVFRGAAKRSRAFSEWTIENLQQEYGNLVVRLEARAEHDNRMPVTELGMGRDTVRHFLDNFKMLNAYVISQIPQPMEKDVAIPPCLRCGNFAKGIQDVHLFIVAKGGKTLLHRDPYSNIHCVFNGTKDWILVQDVYQDNLYQSESSVDEFGGYSNINIDAVDLKMFPDVTKIDYGKVTLNGGDCIFMPASYWHQVRVNGEYNTAASIWFSRNFKHSIQNWDDCANHKFDFTPMSEVDVLWRFSGKNETLTHGQTDINLLRFLLLSYANEDNEISLAQFSKEMLNPKTSDEILQKLRHILDLDDVIRAERLRGLSTEKMKEIMEAINPSDVSNSAEFEYSYIDKEDIRDILHKLLEDNENVSAEKFLREYSVQLGGSSAVAKQVFDKLDAESNGYITNLDVKKNFDGAVKKFLNADQHDPTTERLWLRRLRERDEL